MRIAWFTFDLEEHRDAERVAMLEDAAETAGPLEAVRLLSEADALRAKWDEPRWGERFESLDQILEELQSIARDAHEVDRADADAWNDLAQRATTAGIELECFADRLDEAAAEDR